MPQPHINDDDLDLYALGCLSAEALPGVEEHFLICEACQSRLRLSDEFTALFRRAAAQPDARPTSHWERFWRRPVARAAAAAAMAAVLLVVTRREGSQLAPAIVSMESLRGPEAPARVDAGRPAILVFDIEISTPRSYEARLVDRQGNELQKPRTAAQDGRLAVPLEGLPKGSYWIRVYRAEERDPIAEYGLRVGPQ